MRGIGVFVLLLSIASLSAMSVPADSKVNNGNWVRERIADWWKERIENWKNRKTGGVKTTRRDVEEGALTEAEEEFVCTDGKCAAWPAKLANLVNSGEVLVDRIEIGEDGQTEEQTREVGEMTVQKRGCFSVCLVWKVACAKWGRHCK